VKLNSVCAVIDKGGSQHACRGIDHLTVIDTRPGHKRLDQRPYFKIKVEITAPLLDRLINTSHQILMDGPSYRPRKRPGRTIS
jgi:hypothetical protein